MASSKCIDIGYSFGKLIRLVFCLQNCSDLLLEKKCSSDREKRLKFKAEVQEFAKSLEQFIYSNSERPE